MSVQPTLLQQDSSEEEVAEESEDTQSDDVKPELTYEADFVEYTTHRAASTSKRLSPREEPLRKRPRLRGSEVQCGLDDEYDAIGINVAAKLRYLPDNMRILAEKLISDVLFQAQTNGLTSASVLLTPDPFH